SDGIDDEGAVRSFAGGADDFLVILVAYENDGALLAGEFQGFKVHLGDERAGGVDHFEGALFGFVANRRRNAVSAEDENSAVRDVLYGLDKNSAAAAQLLDDIGVVNDFVVHVDRGAVGFERQLDDIHRADHAGAESARPDPQQHLSIGFSLHLNPN